MPRELVAIAPRQPVLREYEELELQSNQVRVRSEFSAPKHGTELGLYRGTSAGVRARYDEALQHFVPRDEESRAQLFPRRLGNMTVGTVVEIGDEVTRFHVGDRVYGHLPIRETHTVAENRLHPVPEGMTPEQVVYLDPGEFALAAVRDANIRLGETAAVFGLGAIGFMVLQMARLSGAHWIVAVDPLLNRREMALRYGADLALDPSAGDVALAVKQANSGKGVDVAIEASGSYRALHEAIRVTAFGGLTVPLAFYEGEATGLRLGEEAHLNRATLKFSRGISDPNRDHPMWNRARVLHVTEELLRTGRVRVDGLVQPIVPFAEAAEAYRRIDEAPNESIKLGVTYP
jgi:threonine dehydrogenase-like Zn-dependent dehydrogenase